MEVIKLDSLFSIEDSRINSLLDNFLAGKSKNTINAYQKDLISFSEYLGYLNLSECLSDILRSGVGYANEQIIKFKNILIERAKACNH